LDWRARKLDPGAGRARTMRRPRGGRGDELVARVRAGDAAAFEELYDRHAPELLSFCRYLLGTRGEAEDAVQSTFTAAYRALLADERAVVVRPWLFAIARNTCLSTLRRRRPTIDILSLPATDENDEDILPSEVELREEVRETLGNLAELPEEQRASLILSELHGFSHREIARLLDVRPEQVKSYVYQARTTLTSERRARNADCSRIREQLAAARGGSLLRGELRRHLKGCAGCREFAAGIARERRSLGALAPVAPTLALKRRALDSTLGGGGGGGGGLASGGASGPFAGALELLGGGVKAIVAKLAIAVACIGAGTGASSIGATLIGGRSLDPPPVGRAARSNAAVGLTADTTPSPARRVALALAGRPAPTAPTVPTPPPRRAPASTAARAAVGVAATAASIPGQSGANHGLGKAGEAPGQTKEGPAKGRSGEAHGQARSKQARANSEKGNPSRGPTGAPPGQAKASPAKGNAGSAPGPSNAGASRVTTPGQSGDVHAAPVASTGTSGTAGHPSEAAAGAPPSAAHGHEGTGPSEAAGHGSGNKGPAGG
jgi:RNA polymerase sigma factor (sigma-70 family)